MMDNPFDSVQKGSLLVASPDIDFPFYSRSVILLCDHSPVGSFGLRINEKLVQDEIDFAMMDLELPDLGGIDARMAGPLQPSQMMLLHTEGSSPEMTMQVAEDTFIGGDLELLNRSKSEPTLDLILCFGYCAWNPGQLEQEYIEGQWFIHNSSRDIIFRTPIQEIWRTVLMSMGDEYKSFAMMPDDLSLN